MRHETGAWRAGRIHQPHLQPGRIHPCAEAGHGGAGAPAQAGAGSEQARGFLEVAPLVEKLMIKSGIVLLESWLEARPDEQTRRLRARIEDALDPPTFRKQVP